MVPEPTTASRSPRRREKPNTLVNALVGAVVTIVTAPLLPLAALVGGAVSGYLQRGDVSDGVRVGALSGVIAALPAFLVMWVVVGVLLLGADLLFGLTSLLAVLVFVGVVGYLVAAGALGGALGAYLRKEI
jgi:hypothetical protein